MVINHHDDHHNFYHPRGPIKENEWNCGKISWMQLVNKQYAAAAVVCCTFKSALFCNITSTILYNWIEHFLPRHNNYFPEDPFKSIMTKSLAPTTPQIWGQRNISVYISDLQCTFVQYVIVISNVRCSIPHMR